MPILLCPYLINFVSKFRIHSPCTNFSISYLGTIHILRPLILGPIHPLHYVSINTVLNISKNDHFLNPPTQSKCWRNIWMAPQVGFRFLRLDSNSRDGCTVHCHPCNANIASTESTFAIWRLFLSKFCNLYSFHSWTYISLITSVAFRLRMHGSVNHLAGP